MEGNLDQVLSEAQHTTLYQRLGGKLGVYALVDQFYTRVTADEALKPYFAKSDMDRLRLHQAAFLSFAFGGPAYHAPDLSQVHSGLQITADHYDRLTDHLVSVLLDHGFSETEIHEVVDRIVALKHLIIRR